MWWRASSAVVVLAVLGVQFFWLGEHHHHLHFSLRPDADGNWFIQDDADHRSRGVDRKVVQTDEYLEINFLRRYSHAGSIQITADDDFIGVVTAASNLGVTGARVRVMVNGHQINPATVWSHGTTVGRGNLWGSVAMTHDRTWASEAQRIRMGLKALLDEQP